MTGTTGTTAAPTKKTLYEILGVKPDATLVEIQAAHQALAGAAEGALDPAEQIALKEAYRILSDARRRGVYDRSLRQRELPPVVEVDDDDEPSSRSKKPLMALAVVVLIAMAWWFMKSPGKPAKLPAVQTPAAQTVVTPQAAVTPVAATEPARDTLLFGAWRCQGPLTGSGLELNFAPDGTYSGQSSGQPLRGDYTVNGAALTFRDAEQSNAFTIEELAQQRLVIHRGEGKRLTCSR
jgi:curved DNA-binding protein CbpA